MFKILDVILSRPFIEKWELNPQAVEDNRIVVYKKQSRGKTFFFIQRGEIKPRLLSKSFQWNEEPLHPGSIYHLYPSIEACSNQLDGWVKSLGDEGLAAYNLNNLEEMVKNRRREVPTLWEEFSEWWALRKVK